MKRPKRPSHGVSIAQSEHGGYVTIGRIAICNHHGPAHIHPHLDPGHPEHQPRVPIDPSLDAEEVLRRVIGLRKALGRDPGLAELQEALE